MAPASSMEISDGPVRHNPSKAIALCPTFQHVYIVILTALSTGFTLGMYNYSFGLFVPGISTDFPTWTRTTLNGAFSAGQIISNIMAPILGILIDQFGSRIVVSASMCLETLGYLMLGSTESLPQLYLGFILMGLGYTAPTMLAPSKITAAWFPVKKRPFIIGLAMSMNNIGGFVFLQVGYFVGHEYGWRAIAYTFALCLACVALLDVILLRNSPQDKVLDIATPTPNSAASNEPKETLNPNDTEVHKMITKHVLPRINLADSEASLIVAEKEAEKDRNSEPAIEGINNSTLEQGIGEPTIVSSISIAGQQQPETTTQQPSAASNLDADDPKSYNPYYDISLSEALKTRIYYTTSFGLVFTFFCYSGVLSQFLPAIVAEGHPKHFAKNVTSMIALMGIPTKILAGKIASKLSARFSLLIFTTIMILGILIFVADGKNDGNVWAAGAVFGFGFGGVGALVPITALETFGPKYFGRIFGSVNLLYMIPSFCGPFMCGQSFDKTGSYHNAFLGICVIFVVGMGLLAIDVSKASICRGLNKHH